VTENSSEVIEDPSLVNADPLDRGWLSRVRVSEGPDGLLDADADAYAAAVESA
jgi:glycine cleavage system H protein